MSETNDSDVPIASGVCPRCEADTADELGCTRCGWTQYFGDEAHEIPPIASRSDKQTTKISWKKQTDGRRDISNGTYFLLALGTFLIIGLLVCIIVSVSTHAPGIALCFVFLALPPSIRTALVVWRRSSLGLTTTSEKQGRMFVSSLFVTTLMGTTLAMMSVVFVFFAGLFSLISLLLFCFKKPTVYSPVDLALTPVGWLLIIMIATPYICWIVSRWQRDTVSRDE